MIFDVIYEFYYSLFWSGNDVSDFWTRWPITYYDNVNDVYIGFSGADYISAVATVVTIIFGIFALFRIFGGILKLFRV